MSSFTAEEPETKMDRQKRSTAVLFAVVDAVTDYTSHETSIYHVIYSSESHTAAVHMFTWTSDNYRMVFQIIIG